MHYIFQCYSNDIVSMKLFKDHAECIVYLILIAIVKCFFVIVLDHNDTIYMNTQDHNNTIYMQISASFYDCDAKFSIFENNVSFC